MIEGEEETRSLEALEVGEAEAGGFGTAPMEEGAISR